MNNISLKHSLERDGYIVLESISYGNIFRKSKQDHHLLLNLSGNLNNGTVDDVSMEWKVIEYANSNHTQPTQHLSKKQKKDKLSPLLNVSNATN